MDKIAWVSLACLALGACATPVQTAGTTGGVVAGAIVGGPVGAVVGGAAGALVTSRYPRYRCYYHDRYGYVHYHWCR
ncbi:MAG TPA: hypothetical protein VJY34_13515 [Roseiarcus sp.]|nr:hypothetical protein [Roseiarcus sp.]